MIAAHEATGVLAELSEVTYRYPAGTSPALHHVSWEVPEGAFVVVAGGSGSGKSTLLRCLNGLVPHFSGGTLGGAITVAGHDVRRRGPRTLSRSVGFVFQDPETQLLTSRVDDEIAFSLEQHGIAQATMRTRVEEMLDLLGIAALRERDPATLSGGERQRVAVASALALHPRLLVLDEPTSQLDPWGAEDVLAALTRLNEDLGLTVVLSEHRLERVLSHADHLCYLGQTGGHLLDGPVRDVAMRIDSTVLPPVTQIGRARSWHPLPLSIKEGRAPARALSLPATPPDRSASVPGEAAFELQGVALVQAGTSVLREVDVVIRAGELVALMGRNGSGKTTLLRSMMGFHKLQRGRIRLFGRDVTGAEPATIARDVGYLPQQPGALLFAERVADEVRFTLAHRGGSAPTPALARHPSPKSGRGGKGAGSPPPTLGEGLGVGALSAGWASTGPVLERLGLTALAERHPRDLSGGERERAALAAVLAGAPRVLLLDEPTRGMDAWRKAELGETLRELTNEGVAVVLATHDVELVARYATRVVLLGGGEIVADGTPQDVLAGSLTCAPQVNKLLGGTWLTVTEVLDAVDANAPPEPAPVDS